MPKQFRASTRTNGLEERHTSGTLPDKNFTLFFNFNRWRLNMSIEELLQQMQDYRTRREQRDHRPEWIRKFVTTVADVFEPLSDIGRVGFDCQADERGWLICMYLGTTEIIGGPQDGEIQHASFKIDLTRIVGLFDRLDRLEWYSIADSNNADGTRSLLAAHGAVKEEQFVKLELLHSPPKFVTPGLQRNAAKNDGTDPPRLAGD